MERRKHCKVKIRPPALPTVQYLTVNDVMACIGVGRSKAYAIIRELNAELDQDGYITVSGKIPERKFRERLYLSGPTQLAACTSKGRSIRNKK